MSQNSAPSALAIDRAREGDPAWDDFLRSTVGSAHPHRLAWGRVFADVFGHPSDHWVARDDHGTICGVLPITYMRSAVFGKHAVARPFLNDGGPIGTPDAIDQLATHALRAAQSRGFGSLELRARRALPLSLDAVTRKVTMVLEMADTPEALLKRFDGKLRSQVRRAGKEGATVLHGADQLDGFYEVFERHMRDLGTPVMPKAFFATALRTFPDDTWIATVRHEGRAIAGAMGFRWLDEFEITWASALNEYKRMSPNMLLYWGLMERCIRDGVRVFNFGRTTPGSGPHKFKAQWGGTEEPLHWYYPGANGAAAMPQKEQAHFALASKVWRRLPLGVASRLGPLIVRGIP